MACMCVCGGGGGRRRGTPVARVFRKQGSREQVLDVGCARLRGGGGDERWHETLKLCRYCIYLLKPRRGTYQRDVRRWRLINRR